MHNTAEFDSATCFAQRKKAKLQLVRVTFDCQSNVEKKSGSVILTLSSWTMLYALKESRPEVGSSRKSRAGSVISSTPTLVLLRWPPDMPEK